MYKFCLSLIYIYVRVYIFKLRYFCENNTRYIKKRYKSSVLLIFLLTYSTAQNMFCEKQECFWITVQLVNTLSYLQACRSAQSCQLVGENAVHSLPKLTGFLSIGCILHRIKDTLNWFLLYFFFLLLFIFSH